MRVPIRRPASLVLAIVAAAAVAGACGGSAASSVTTEPASAASAPPTASEAAPSLTPVPGGTTPTPEASEPPGTTTETGWGTILDAVPADFPVYPDAEAVDPIDGPASGAWSVPADAGTVARWYENALAAAGYSSNDRSGPLEDGSYTVDTQSDLPECRIQTNVRPQGDTSMITVLFGAGCVGLGG